MTPAMCLALAIWFECRSCTEAEQIQVAATVLHRAADKKQFKRYKTACDVVNQPKQFSFKKRRLALSVYKDRADKSTGQDGQVWRHSQRLAKKVMVGKAKPNYSCTLHFHKLDMIPPDWAMKKSPRYKDRWAHVFYCDR